MPKDKVYIIGVGASGKSSLTEESCRIIEEAEILFGGARLLDMFPSGTKARVIISNNLVEITRQIKANLGKNKIVVLASGDPNFFGIAKYLTTKLGKDVFEIIPNVSSMQSAFALIKESWEDAAFASVHARPIAEIIDVVRSSHKIGIFTDNEHTPAVIVRTLMAHGVAGYRAYVCHSLGGEKEGVIEADLESLSKMECPFPNVLVLLKTEQGKIKNRSRFLGIPDEEFHCRKPAEGLITKLEVRAVSLAKMRLTEDSVLWDIGAGSGAISVEASLLARSGCIFAIEKNFEDVAIIKENLRKLSISNVEVVRATAPDGLGKLPDPDVVFIGGSGGQAEAILDTACHRLKRGGRIVINVITIERLSAMLAGLKTRGFTAEVTLINIARNKDIANLTRLEALNPVFVITGQRGTANG